jgi:hypothetical protein
MQENQLNLNEQTNSENPQDLLNASLIFARALSLILEDSQGIVVDLQGGIELASDTTKVIVFKHEDQVHIYKCEDDLVEGTAVRMSNTEIPSEEN